MNDARQDGNEGNQPQACMQIFDTSAATRASQQLNALGAARGHTVAARALDTA